MTAWDFLVRKDNLGETMVASAPPPEAVALADGEALVAIERFSLTANNITYGRMGDQLGYWRFFPAPEGWGRIPVWGFGTVTASRTPGLSAGTRLYGYWPMSTHLVMRPRMAGSGLVDEAPARLGLPPIYNHYDLAPETAHDDEAALLRPLFTTSFLLDDFLAELAPTATPILSSASSRTALGLAWLLRQRGVPAIGVTSRANTPFLTSTGLYGHIIGYDGAASLDHAGQLAFVDIAGNAQLRDAVHCRFDAQLSHSLIVGGTHRGAGNPHGPPATEGPQPMFFFAPDRMVARKQDWGDRLFSERIAAAMAGFIDGSPWLEIRRHYGSEAWDKVFQQVLRGEATAQHGHICLPA